MLSTGIYLNKCMLATAVESHERVLFCTAPYCAVLHQFILYPLTVILVVECTSELTLEGVLPLVLSLLTPSSSHDSMRALR